MQGSQHRGLWLWLWLWLWLFAALDDAVIYCVWFKIPLATDVVRAGGFKHGS